MRLNKGQIQRLAEMIYNGLAAESLIKPRKDRGIVVDGIGRALAADLEREQNLDRDAERMLDETLAAMGRGAADIDRRRMLKMIKEKLAKERNVVL